MGAKKRADVSTFKGQVYVSIREWFEVCQHAKGLPLLCQHSVLSSFAPAQHSLKSADEFFDVVAFSVQKDGKLMPGAKGISLHASDQFNKLEAASTEISAALQNQDELYELPLSDKCACKPPFRQRHTKLLW